MNLYLYLAIYTGMFGMGFMFACRKKHGSWALPFFDLGVSVAIALGGLIFLVLGFRH